MCATLTKTPDEIVEIFQEVNGISDQWTEDHDLRESVKFWLTALAQYNPDVVQDSDLNGYWHLQCLASILFRLVNALPEGDEPGPERVVWGAFQNAKEILDHVQDVKKTFVLDQMVGL